MTYHPDPDKQARELHAARQARRALVVDRLVPLLRERGPLRCVDAARLLGVRPTALGVAASESPRTIRVDRPVRGCGPDLILELVPALVRGC
jgi:hypothetical protein